jgi:hypothetical protein
MSNEGRGSRPEGRTGFKLLDVTLYRLCGIGLQSPEDG